MKKRSWFQLQIGGVCIVGILLAAIVVATKLPSSSADELRRGHSVGTYPLENLPIYRQVGPQQFKVDASVFIELARAIAVQNESQTVTFDEKRLELEVVSTPENLRRLGDSINQMYHAMEVKLETKSFDSEQLKKLITDQNLKPGDPIKIK